MTFGRRALALGTALLAALALGGCGSADPGTDLLAEHDLAGLTGREIVERLDSSDRARPLPLGASVLEDEVVLTDGETQVAVALPRDEHYVAVAPYVEHTHECHHHSLATCQGELVGQAVHVTITAEDGTVLVDEDTTTRTNGFVGFWLPRDTAGTIEVVAAGRRGSAPFSTGDGDPTCVTTLRLT